MERYRELKEQNKVQYSTVAVNLVPRNSVVDPNTLNLDPDPGFWPEFGSGSRIILSILKEKIKNNFRVK